MVTRSLVLVCALAAAAHADRAQLEAARQAIEGVRYDEAQRLLAAALTGGGNQPAELAEIYKLSGNTAVVLGQADSGEQYYRRWLALEPSASLGADVSPKLRAPFDAAKAYIGAHGTFVALASRADLGAASVQVVTDPLAMARGVRLADSTAVVPLDRDRVAQLVVAATATRVDVVDEYGNVLRVLELPPPETRTDNPNLPTKLVTHPGGKHRAALLGWGIPCATSLLAGAFFTVYALYEHSRIDDLASDSKGYFYDDLRSAQRQRNTMTALGSTFGGIGLLLVVPTAIYWVKNRSRTERVVAPVITDTSAGVSFAGQF